MNRKQTVKRAAFDPQKLLTNAIHSIELGADDFNASREDEGSSIRALSAARNFYSGLLLLFKYRIAITTKDLEKAVGMIYIPEKILPYINENGEIEWRPSNLSKDKTIDYRDIKGRFESLGITTDWEAVTNLQKCRNNLEHFSPEHSMVDIGRFVANLYPILHRFIVDELKAAPADLLGSAWSSMMKFHDFYKQSLEAINSRWSALGLPPNAALLLKECSCDACNSSLLAPNREDAEIGLAIDISEFRYQCVECHYSDSLSENLETNLSLAQSSDIFSEGTNIVECESCFFVLFSLLDEYCHWCGHTARVHRCAYCNDYLSDIEARHGVSCDRCSEDEYNHEQHLFSLKGL